jgi:hypothetical protein
MKPNDLNLIPSNIVMQKFIILAINYYKELLPKISPYFFRDDLIKMVGFQQLIVSRTYQIKRNDARSSKGIDYVKECISQISKPLDLLELMRNWDCFDLNLTAPSFVNPLLASNIRKKYCKVGSKYFDCNHCSRIVCRKNLIWNESTIMLDCDTQRDNLENQYNLIRKELNTLNISHSIKLSSLNGFHINIGLPERMGSTLFDRSVAHYCLTQELLGKGLPIDDNSLDPVPIMRAPFSLHYKRLTPSLPVNDKTIEDAIEILKEIEKLPLEDRIAYSKDISKGWYIDWFVKNSSRDSYSRIFARWKDNAEKAIFRESNTFQGKKTNVGDYLGKGKLMKKEDEKMAFRLLKKEGKSDELARKIIEINKRKKPKTQRDKERNESQNKDIIIENQHDIPLKIQQIPPPLVLLIIDNATLKDFKNITGIMPLKAIAECLNTDEGFSLLFRDSKLLKTYAKKWQCNSIFIGGLYTSYNYCAAADLVVGVKMKNVWERDIKILKELETKIAQDTQNLIAAHLLGLDFCKDNQLDTEGALLIFKKFIKKILNSNYNIILTTDHSGEQFVPYFELITHNPQNERGI